VTLTVFPSLLNQADKNRGGNNSLLGARRAMNTMPQFQGSGAVPKRALMLGTPNTWQRGQGGRRVRGFKQGCGLRAHMSGSCSKTLSSDGDLGTLHMWRRLDQPANPAWCPHISLAWCPDVTSGRL
jgi:hypothetical protein